MPPDAPEKDNLLEATNELIAESQRAIDVLNQEREMIESRIANEKAFITRLRAKQEKYKK